MPQPVSTRLLATFHFIMPSGKRLLSWMNLE